MAGQQIRLDAQQQMLDEQKSMLGMQAVTMGVQSAIIGMQSSVLATRQAELDQALADLTAREAELTVMQAELVRQQDLLDSQTRRISDMVGVRGQIITELSDSLRAGGIAATVDPVTGDIVLESTVFFDTGKNTISEEGRALLDRFVPIYLDVLLQPGYSDYVAQIIIEGHTDTQGDYFTNLRLSQQRALAVATYCLQMPGLTHQQQTLLRSILTATGRSYSDPVYAPDGSVDMNASRRVEFKFSLKDSEMINEMNRLLTDGGNKP